MYRISLNRFATFTEFTEIQAKKGWMVTIQPLFSVGILGNKRNITRAVIGLKKNIDIKEYSEFIRYAGYKNPWKLIDRFFPEQEQYLKHYASILPTIYERSFYKDIHEYEKEFRIGEYHCSNHPVNGYFIRKYYSHYGSDSSTIIVDGITLHPKAKDAQFIRKSVKFLSSVFPQPYCIGIIPYMDLICPNSITLKC